MPDKKASILVTGASGLLGANLVLTLREHGYQVIAVSQKYPVRGEGIITRQLDLSNENAASQLIKETAPGCMIHCAALTDLDYCESHPDEAMHINAHMPGELAALANDTGVPFVYISTDSVFDGKKGDYNEEDTPSPLNHYAKSKLAGEEAVRCTGGNYLIARVNIFGWNAQAKQSLAEWMLSQLEKNTPFNGFDDIIFNPLLVNDLSEILIKMMAASLSGTFHLGGSDYVSKFAFGQALAREFGYDPALVKRSSSDTVNFKTPRPKITTLNTGKISSALGIKLPDMQEGLARFRRLREEGVVARLQSLVKG